jgi:hypothetical protein
VSNLPPPAGDRPSVSLEPIQVEDMRPRGCPRDHDWWMSLLTRRSGGGRVGVGAGVGTTEQDVGRELNGVCHEYSIFQTTYERVVVSLMLFVAAQFLDGLCILRFLPIRKCLSTTYLSTLRHRLSIGLF